MNVNCGFFFSNFCSNFLKMKRTGVVAKSKKFFFNLQTHWKTAFSFLSLVKRTIIWVIFFIFFFQIFKAYLGKKKVESGIWLGFELENGTQNLTFSSQFVKSFKVSSLAIFQVFMVFYHKIWKNKPFLSWKRIFFFKIFKVF